jgi:hypothetical protein
LESKKYWRTKGEGVKSGDRKKAIANIHSRKTMRKGSESSINTQAAKNLNYLKKTM